MKLVIETNSTMHGIDVTSFSCEQFAKKEYHPYIAGTKWDSVNIEICDTIPRGYITQVLLKCGLVIPIIKKDKEFSRKEVMLLCEVYPDSAKDIKELYSTDTKLTKVLEELSSTYNWEFVSK